MTLQQQHDQLVHQASKQATASPRSTGKKNKVCCGGKNNSTTTTTPNKLREIRRASFLQKLENRPAVELLQYGSVTLIHRKLDSWIDAKPDIMPHHYTWHDNVLTLDDSESDHLLRRVRSLSKKPGRLARSWSGNINLIQKESLIDGVPRRTAELQETGNTAFGKKKRTKPRRCSGDHAYPLMKQSSSNTMTISGSGVSGDGDADGANDSNSDYHYKCCGVRAKDVLLDGDIQTVRKVVLERKLCLRPKIENPETWGQGLCHEVHRLKQTQQDVPYHKAVTTSKTSPLSMGRQTVLTTGEKNHSHKVHRGVTRVHSLNRATMGRPTFIMPTSA